MSSSRFTAWIALLVALPLTGCVSIDSRAIREEADREATKSLRAAFLNRADYRSKGELVAHETLAEALGLPARSAAWVYVWRISDSEVLVRFVTGSEVVHERRYRAGVDLSVGSDQRLELSKPTVCGGRDSPGFGCGGGSVSLFVNRNGELAAVESGGGAGVIGIFPIAIYAKHLATFTRVQDAPPLSPQ